MRVPAAALVLLLAACRMPWQPEDRSCADHARLDLPVDLADYAVGGKLWPFGAHGGAHPEGHPGVDFLLDPADARGDIPVKASFSADIISITPETEIPGSSCIVMDSACVEVNLCHVILDPALKVGGRVEPAPPTSSIPTRWNAASASRRAERRRSAAAFRPAPRPSWADPNTTNAATGP
jgi:hypothetical protein